MDSSCHGGVDNGGKQSSRKRRGTGPCAKRPERCCWPLLLVLWGCSCTLLHSYQYLLPRLMGCSEMLGGSESCSSAFEAS